MSAPASKGLPPGPMLEALRILDTARKPETVTLLKPSSVGPTMLPPPAILRGQVQA